MSEQCSRTGKRWRCSNTAAPGRKFCESCLAHGRKLARTGARGWVTKRRRVLSAQRNRVMEQLEELHG